MNPGARIKLVQIAKRELALTEEDYRAILLAHGGYASSKDVVRDDPAFDRVMTHFRALGFKSTAHKTAYDREPNGTRATAGQVHLIRQLWRENSKDSSETALDRWLERQFKVSSLRFLPAEKVSKVISALRRWRQRKTAKAEAGAE